MTPLDFGSNSDLSVDEIIIEITTLPGVRKFEYEPRNGFLHAEVDRDVVQPYTIVQKLEELDISSDGLFLFFPKSPWTDYTQHLRYNARMKTFLHSNGNEVDAAKIKMVA